MKKFLFMFLLLIPATARADFINFAVNPSADLNATLSYGGARDGLVGIGMHVGNVVGISTPIHDGGIQLYPNAEFHFSTDSYFDNNFGTGWRFSQGSGGDIAIEDGSGNPANALLHGHFTGFTVIQQTANDFKIVSSSNIVSLSSVIADFYGVDPTKTYDAAVTLLFLTKDKPGQSFLTAEINGGSIAVDVSHPHLNVPIPEPGSVVLLGMGGVALLGGYFRRRLSVV